MFRIGLAFLIAGLAWAQTYETPENLGPRARRDLAQRLLADASETDETAAYERLLLLLEAGEAEKAVTTAQRLATWPRKGLQPIAAPVAPLFELLARTRLAEQRGLDPEAALDTGFEEMLAGGGSRGLYRLGWALVGGDAATFEQLLSKRWEALRTKPRLSRSEAMGLVRLAQTRDAVARLRPGAVRRQSAEEDKRFMVEDDVHIPLPSGGFLCATVARPRAAGRVPTALEFTIYARESVRSQVLRSAVEGYAGVIAFSRGKRHSPGPVVPFEHDGEDAAVVIAWIAAQPWSDGKVGMYGGSYNGFTQWAAAKHRPPALRSIMPSVAVAPGIDVPMEGGVPQAFFYEWAPYTTKGPFLDETAYRNQDHWERVKLAWYASERPYREMDAFDEAPNPFWRRWLEHPTYDAYWQRMTASGEDFAGMDLPVLATSGYFDGCLLSTTHYFESHLGRRPEARHYLVLGPYNHFGGQFQSWDEVEGYAIDPTARLDIEALRYQWLNHTLRGGPLPALLKDRVNVQVMGADRWRHAPTLEALGGERLSYRLAGRRLWPEGRRQGGRPAELRVDLARRAPTSTGKPEQALQVTFSARNALTFEGDPLGAPLELSGRFEGAFVLATNKRDFDLTVQLFERLPDGRHFLLSHFTARGSQMKDPRRRELLKPGREARLAFRSGRPVSRLLGAGSRLVLVVGIPKHPGSPVNYGTGKPVSDETVQDAGEPLRIRFSPRSTLTLPVNPVRTSRP